MTEGNNENFIDEAMNRAGLRSINRSLKKKKQKTGVFPMNKLRAMINFSAKKNSLARK